MIKLGKFQILEVIRKASVGVYLNTPERDAEQDILLPQNQVTDQIEIGDELEVFVYNDSEDRIIATINSPKLCVGDIGVLEVVDVTKVGAFLDWGLEKDLLLPYSEQATEVEKGDKCFVGVYVDNSDRLCATMKIYDLLSVESSYNENERVEGTVYQINEEFGAFVAVNNKYHGLIPNNELFSKVEVGDTVEVRVKKVREDGKLVLSLREKAYIEIEGDAQKIMEKLSENDGKININDKSSPEIIKKEFNISKSSFKRAVGRLLKEGVIEITDDGIRRII